jgi:hypothetical protein
MGTIGIACLENVLIGSENCSHVVGVTLSICGCKYISHPPLLVISRPFF